MRNILAALLAFVLGGGAIVGVVVNKHAEPSTEGKAASPTLPPVVAGNTGDDSILKLLGFTNEHVSELEVAYEDERQQAAVTAKTAYDNVQKYVDATGTLDLHAAAGAGEAEAMRVHKKMQVLFAKGRELTTALAELPEVYEKAAEHYRNKNTPDSKRMAEFLQQRAVAVRNTTHLPGLPEKSVVDSFPTLAAFFSEFGKTFGQEPKIIAQLSASSPNAEADLIRSKLVQLATRLHALLGLLTGGVAAPAAPVAVTAAQQQTFPLWDVWWSGRRVVDGAEVFDHRLRLNHDGTFERQFFASGKLTSQSDSLIVFERGLFTFVGNTLSFFKGDKLLQRGGVEISGLRAGREFFYFIYLADARSPASSRINYSR